MFYLYQGRRFLKITDHPFTLAAGHWGPLSVNLEQIPDSDTVSAATINHDISTI